jgi:hypothetical protein
MLPEFLSETKILSRVLRAGLGGPFSIFGLFAHSAPANHFLLLIRSFVPHPVTFPSEHDPAATASSLAYLLDQVQVLLAFAFHHIVHFAPSCFLPNPSRS